MTFHIAYRENIQDHPVLGDVPDRFQRNPGRRLSAGHFYLSTLSCYVLVNSGTGRAEIDGDVVDVQPGTVLLIDHGLGYRLRESGESRLDARMLPKVA
ncbi:MAG: hypothetical protein J4400_01595 [Candidatus Aenigmarchaeota archaeon]|nr:hypothetical protein [Candidatus Aenigmarchaeota archaeon]